VIGGDRRQRTGQDSVLTPTEPPQHGPRVVHILRLLQNSAVAHDDRVSPQHYVGALAAADLSLYGQPQRPCEHMGPPRRTINAMTLSVLCRAVASTYASGVPSAALSRLSSKVDTTTRNRTP
jgi:hypothetical protein